MVFFDLNVPYLERDATTTNPTLESAAAVACKATRLRLIVKSMELGFSGVAYNKTIRGVISDLERCKIVPFDLSSLLKVAPGLAVAAKLHRELLGASTSSSFRQYTRLTAVVDSAQGASALSSGNAVLRSYHLVAARPLNQAAFDQICKVSEVDIISIDFSQKLPFRPKLSLVKAAIERGIYFEINYSPIISDLHSRRQILTDAKILVDWTRGKNLIFSSGASCVNDVRGPYDIINLMSLLGLSMEKAKLALSKNCSRLLTSALRRRECYDGGIRVEKYLPGAKDSSKDWFPDWNHWDPISSGDGDLPALNDEASNKIDGSTLNEISPGRISPIREESPMKIDGMGENFSDMAFAPVSEVQFPDNHESFSPVCENFEANVEEKQILSCSFVEIVDNCEPVELFSDAIHRSNPDGFESVSVSPSTETKETSPRTRASMNVSETLCQEERTESGPSWCLEKVSMARADSSLLSTVDEAEASMEEALTNVEISNMEDEIPQSETVIGVDLSPLPESISPIEVSQETKVSVVEDEELLALNKAFVFGHQNPKRRKVQHLPPRFLFASKHCIQRLFFRRRFQHSKRRNRSHQVAIPN
ncbi:polymerase/histidinol phosphatase-like protein isoform X2 [Wolffia australiana]